MRTNKFLPDQQVRPESRRRLSRMNGLVLVALSDIILRDDFGESALSDGKVILSEVRMSPDLRNATIYALTMLSSGPEDDQKLLEALRRVASRLRWRLSSRVRMRHVPTLSFTLDTRFRDAQHIEGIIRKIGTEHETDTQDRPPSALSA